MTIAAGFFTRDGILMCADTQYESAAKVHQTKIFPAKCGAVKVVFALAGSEDYAKMAIEDCIEAIGTPDDSVTYRDIKKRIRGVIHRIATEYVDKRPPNEFPHFNLLIAIQMGGDLRLLQTNGPVVRVAQSMAIVGSGEYLARYLMEPAYDSYADAWAVMVQAARMLSAVKSYDAHCGGSSEMLLIKNDGSFEAASDRQVKHSEQLGDQYDIHCRALMYSLADPSMDIEHLDARLALFNSDVKRLADAWRTGEAAHRRHIEIRNKYANRIRQLSGEDAP